MSNREENDTALRGVVEWLLAGWAMSLALLILVGGADRWRGNHNLAIAMQAPGHQYTWGALLALFALGKLCGIAGRRKVTTGIFSGLIALWCYALFCTQLVAVMRDDTAGTIGPAAWALIGTLYLTLCVKHVVNRW